MKTVETLRSAFAVMQPLIMKAGQEDTMRTRHRNSAPIWLIMIILALTIAACGSSDAEDSAAGTSGESIQAEEQVKNELPAADDAKDSSQTEAAEEPAADEETVTSDSDEDSAEMEGDSDAVKHANFEDIQAMHVTMGLENLDTAEILKASYSFVRPDRFLVDLFGLETLVIGDTTYTRLPQGEWTEQSARPAEGIRDAVEELTTGFLDEAAIYELIEDPSNSGLSQTGEETINGVETLVYTYDGGISSPLAGLINGEVKVWLGRDDGLLYRHEVVNATDSGLGPRSKSIIEIVYGDAVTIEGPE